MSGELKVATPLQMVEAWEVGVMHGSPGRAFAEFRENQPVAIEDPIYHRREDGWHNAAGITNPSAIARMRSYLNRYGLRAPDATEATWDATLARLDAKAKVQEAMDAALRDAWAMGATTVEGFATVVADRVTNLL